MCIRDSLALNITTTTTTTTPREVRRLPRLGATTVKNNNVIGAKASLAWRRRGVTLTVRAEGEDTATPAPLPPSPEEDAGGAGKTLAGAGFAVGVGLFALTTLGGAPTLASLEKDAVPLDVAMSNGRPTVVEFYADW